MKSGPFIACLDLLATKESALISGANAEAKMEEFRRYAALSARLFQRDGATLRIYGDFAYVQSNSLTELANFLIELRTNLFDRRNYFKAAVVVGDLELASFRDDWKMYQSGKGSDGNAPEFVHRWGLSQLEQPDLEKISEIFDATYFGSDAVKAVLLYEKFKGVGIILDDTVEGLANEDLRLSPKLLHSFFLGGKRRSVVQRFLTLRLSETEIRDFAAVVENYRAATLRDQSYGLYYLPHIIAFIKSVDLASIEVKLANRTKDVEEKRSLRAIDYRFEITDCAVTKYLFAENRFFKDFARSGFVPLLVAAYVAELYKSRDLVRRYSEINAFEDLLLVYVIGRIARKDGLIERVALVSESILSRPVRDHFLKLYVEHTDFANRMFDLRKMETLAAHS